MPSRLSWYARRLAPMRVEVKTNTWRKSRDCTRYASSSRLRSRRTGCATCCTNSAAVLSRATCTSTGSCRNESASVRMSSDRVAENSRFWRCLGRSAMMRRTSGMNPISSMRSASSRTKASTCCRFTAFCWTWSSSRPGVATRNSTPWRRAAVCGFISIPPNTTVLRRPTYFPYVRTLCSTCAANSRVGVRMSARTGWRAGDALVLACRANRCRSGSVNPAVLPVPVWAPPRTSRPCSTNGIACAWIGVGSTYPCSATAFSSSGSRSSSAKLGKRILSFRPRSGPKKLQSVTVDLRTGWATIRGIIAKDPRQSEGDLPEGEFQRSARSMALQRPDDVLAHECRPVLRSRAQCREHAPAPRSIAESHGEIAQPALVANPQDRAAGHALSEFVSVPREKVDELGAVQTVTHLEIRLRRELRVAVPRANELAVIAAEDTVADERPQFDGNAPFQLDREVGNAAPRVQRIRCNDGARRANIQTLGTAAAVLAHRGIQGKRQIRVDVSEKEIRARLAREQEGVFAPPAESRLACQLHFHHRRRIGKHAVTELTDFACNPFGELPQSSPQHLVIVAPKRIAGHECLVTIGENAPAFGRAGTIVHACRNNAQRAGNEGRGLRPFAAMLSHIIEFAGEARCEPCGEARFDRREVGVGDSDRLETQLAPPGFDRRGEHHEIGGPHSPRPDCLQMTHPPDHSQPPAKAHWITTYLPDEGATAGIGAKLAAGIGPGMRIYLRGDLGTGKTTLIRGLLRALGVKDTVKSPSYALVELYVVSRLNLYHFDFYRFLDAKEFEDAGLAGYFHGTGVCLVEWPERAGDALPPPDLELSLAYTDTGREISVKAHSAAGERCLAKSQDA